ncbi:MAG: 4-hydroxy-tetrahydrodipicolinate synthase [Microcystaceae cyanobacterium]
MTDPIFGQVITAMVTPLDTEGNINYPLAEKLAVHLLENGSDGLVVCGTTGESPTLTYEEEHELFKVIRQAVGNKAKIIVGTGSNCTREAIEATQKASELQIDGSLQVVPYYNKPSQKGLYEHFRAIAQACPDVPIMLYNVPSRTGQNLLPETVIQLAEVDNIVAIKEASGILDQAGQIRRKTPAEFAIYSGDDSITLPILSIGGVGVVSVASHLVGRQMKQMIESFVSGKVEEAREIHLGLFPLFKALFCTTNPVPVKAALELVGWPVGNGRLPLPTISPEEKNLLESVLKDLSLL